MAYVVDGGNSGGHIMQDDLRSRIGYFGAPSGFLGDKSKFIGGAFSFDTKIHPPLAWSHRKRVLPNPHREVNPHLKAIRFMPSGRETVFDLARWTHSRTRQVTW